MSMIERAVDALAGAGGDLIEPPVLVRAKVPLELSGETVRSRICTFIDQEAREWALRPDFTLVVAQDEVEARRAGISGETVRRYAGPVFRLPGRPNAPVEYDQVGLEKFGAPSDVDADAWLFKTLIAATEACSVTTGRAQFGDLSIFPAFVDAMSVAPDVAAGLKRAFRQEGGVRAFINGQSQNQSGMGRRLAGMSKEEVAAFVDDIFAMTNVQPVGSRGADEIAERLYERSRSSGGALSDVQKQILDSVLSLDVPLADAASALEEIAQTHSLSGLSEQLSAFADRANKILATQADGFLESARFATRFGRRFTYYDGFVFEITDRASEETVIFPFVAGGRYDSLLSDLSNGDVDATGLGGIIVPHRLPSQTGADA
ncbi:MAG: ATP phosphoribosyltransferase regulatory subunit [Pseudomonadota bacterium]